MSQEKQEKKKKPIFKRLIIILWLVFVLGLTTAVGFIYMVANDTAGLFGGMPDPHMLENPESDLASELYTADGMLLGKYFRQNRTPVTYNELSPHLVNSLLAAEDLRFRDHSGIDLKALFRVAFGVITFNQKGGGSTISQQLAKNMFKTRGQDYQGSLTRNNRLMRLIVSKMKEWVIAVQLERSYTKEEIMAMYFNTIEFGGNAFGVRVASKTFFNTTQDSLSVQQAALLVGMLNAPSYYNPIRHPERATEKRNLVLHDMYQFGFMNNQQYDSLRNTTLGLEYEVENHNEGLATYFRSQARNFLMSWADQNGYDLFADGLKVYTTIDSRLQAYAENAVHEHMKNLQELFNDHWEGRNPWVDDRGREITNFIDVAIQRTPHYRKLVDQYGEDSDSVDIVLNTPKEMTVFAWEGEIDTLMSPIDSLKYYKHFLHAGFMAMEPQTGHVKAWVGGINHKFFKYDHVRQGRRQPGSTFKPLVYATAIDNGYSPCDEFDDVPVSIPVVGDPPVWTPKNAGGKFSGETMTLRQAMARSVNSITAQVINKVGPSTVVEYARRLGIKSHLDPVPALCLGVNDVSVYELVGAYSAFVNKGTYTKPFYISRIEDKNGNVLQEFVQKNTEALSEETAYLMLHMLKGTTEEEGGTALGLDRELRINNEIGGKTGTTNNQSDGWFMGVTKDLVAGAWVGGDDRSIHFRTIRLGQGARMAMPIYEGFMQKVYADSSLTYSKGEFEEPQKPLSVEINCNKYDEAFAKEEDETDSLKAEPVQHTELEEGGIW